MDALQKASPTRSVARDTAGPRRVLWAAAAAVPLALLACAVYAVLRPRSDPRWLYEVFNPIHLEHFGTQDVRAQNWAYRVFLLAAAALAAAAVWRSPPGAVDHGVTPVIGARDALAWVRARRRAVIAAVSLLALALVVADRLSPSLPMNLASAVGGALALVWVLSRGGRKAASWVHATIVGVAIAALSLPFFWTDRSLFFTNGPTALALYEHHYVLIMSWGEQLGEGVPFANEVNIAYNYLWPVVVGGLRRLRGELPWSFYLHTIGAFAVVFAAGSIALVARATRDRVVTVVGAVVLLAWNHVGSEGFHYPNQAAFRYAGLLFLLWILWALRDRRSLRAEIGAAAAAAACYLWNPATGIAGVAATVTMLLAGRGAAPVVPAAARIVALIAAITAVFMVAVAGLAALVSGQWYFPNPFPKGLSLVSSLGGLKFEWHSAALVVLAGALVQVLSSARAFRRLGPQERFRMACAVACLVWGVYWVNRPHWMNLKGTLFLFLFVAADWVRLIRVSLRRVRAGRREAPLAWLALAILAGGLAPTVVFLGLRAVKRAGTAYATALSARREPARQMSGVLIHPSTAAYVDGLAAEIRRQADAAGQRVLVLTKHSYLVPRLAGARADLPLGDPFFEGFTREGLDRVVAYVRDAPSRTLLVEKVDTKKGGGELGRYDQHFQEVISRLGSTFVLQERRGSFDVYARR